ncbi:MAG: YfiR family protein [Labilithrix sp.]
MHRVRLVLLTIVSCGLFSESTLSAAEEVLVPPALQAELVAKVAGYDKNFATRAGDRAHVLIIVLPTNPDSTTFGTSIQTALGGLPAIAGLPHDETIVPYPGSAQLVALCKSKRAAIVYLAPGLRDEVPKVRAALEGTSVLSVSANAEDVAKGIVLGFDLVSGKPKIVVQLTQAKKQDVAFRSELLKLARVIE